MEKHKTCSFFGHRNTEINLTFRQELKNIIEDLIVNYSVYTFLFGSRSSFDYVCHLVVSELKEKYPYIKRIAYTCKHETCVLEKNLNKENKLYYQLGIKQIALLSVEEEFCYKTKFISNIASYIQRNQEMINNSDYCIFYYNTSYKPEIRKKSKNSSYYQPKSGTAIAYQYAKRKQKIIINTFK